MTVTQATEILKAAGFTPGVDSTRGRKDGAEIKDACNVLRDAKAAPPVIPPRPAPRGPVKTPRTVADMAPRKTKAERLKDAQPPTPSTPSKL
jgi:hypothetical protein